jgi:hypothetical protein
MRADVPPSEVMAHTFWLGDEPMEASRRMQRISECIGEVRPLVQRPSGASSDRQLVWALTAIIVDMSLDIADAEIKVAILRTNARLLELETGGDLLGFAGPALRGVK